MKAGKCDADSFAGRTSINPKIPSNPVGLPGHLVSPKLAIKKGVAGGWCDMQQVKG